MSCGKCLANCMLSARIPWTRIIEVWCPICSWRAPSDEPPLEVDESPERLARVRCELCHDREAIHGKHLCADCRKPHDYPAHITRKGQAV